MVNQLKEYTGTGASGGNSTDGNDIPSPRPFVDDEAELDNYLEKNRYGGEGNHYRKEPALPNPNRTRFTKFEEEMKEDLDLGHEDNEPHMIKADLYRIGKYALGLYKMVDQFDGEGEVDFPSWWQAKITKSKDYLIGAKHYLDFELKKPQIDASIDEVKIEVDDPEDLNKIDRSKIKDTDTIVVKKQNENKMKKSDLLKDYISSRKDTNLNEQMEIHRKKAKRSVLMESVAEKMNDLFEMGRTNEEIVLDYANKGVQVPESLVEKFRKQYENLKKMKLEYEMNEKAFKNEASDIVNNPDEQVVNSEEKTLSSGIYESKKTK